MEVEVVPVENECHPQEDIISADEMVAQQILWQDVMQNDAQLVVQLEEDSLEGRQFSPDSSSGDAGVAMEQDQVTASNAAPGQQQEEEEEMIANNNEEDNQEHALGICEAMFDMIPQIGTADLMEAGGLNEQELVYFDDVYEENQDVYENEVELETTKEYDWLFPDEFVPAPGAPGMREVMIDPDLSHEEKYLRSLITPWRKYSRDHLKRKITVIVTATKEVPANIANVNTLKQVLHHLICFKEYNLKVTFVNPK
jgi:hypothetical protein